MEDFIAKFLPYDKLQEQALKNTSIVVPDKNTTERGTAGLVYMYNESSGLRLDDNKRLCIAPANKSDIDTGTSNNKPIVPAFMPYALQRFGHNFKVAIVEKNATFEIKPGMIALVLPWDKSSFYKPDGSEILTNGGTSIVIATDKVNGNNELSETGTNYWVAILSISGLSSSSKHNLYSTSSGCCYFKNAHNDTVSASNSGRAYVYYLG